MTTTTHTPTMHRQIQLAVLADYASDEARAYRCRAIKATEIHNAGAAIYFVNRAQRCDSIVYRARAAMGAK